MGLKKELFSGLVFLLFAGIAVALWFALDNIFYLFNFLYIGFFVALGIYLMLSKRKYARNVALLGVGLYMLVFLGLIEGENMQLAGFWFYLFNGVFMAATIHYFVAKIAGPFLFGRGWCGYACWTAMVLDLLPFKVPRQKRKKRLGFIRYLVFASTFLFVLALFVFRVQNIEWIMYVSFIAGNLLYYAVGIALAFAFKDNRAFCKYVCPITVFLKPASYFSLLRVKVNHEKCIGCGKCEQVCPMNVEVTNNSRRTRKYGTECILCLECAKNCPKDAIKF